MRFSLWKKERNRGGFSLKNIRLFIGILIILFLLVHAEIISSEDEFIETSMRSDRCEDSGGAICKIR